MKKRFIAGLLVMCLLVGSCPIWASADRQDGSFVGHLSGTITDAISGQPLSGVKIYVYQDWEGIEKPDYFGPYAITDEKGKYSLSVNLITDDWGSTGHYPSLTCKIKLVCDGYKSLVVDNVRITELSAGTDFWGHNPNDYKMNPGSGEDYNPGGEDETPGEIVDSGKCGDSAFWALNSSGLLTIWGNGCMNHFILDDPPWKEYLNEIVKIDIKYGIESIGYNAFRYCENMMSISIPNTVHTINNKAFYDCGSLRDVYYGGSKIEGRRVIVYLVSGPYSGISNAFHSGRVTIHYNSSGPDNTSTPTPLPTIDPNPSTGPNTGTSNSIRSKAKMFIPVGDTLDLTADIVIKTLVPGDTVHWTVKSNDNVRLSQDGALELTHPLGSVPMSGIVQDTVRLYGNSVGSTKIECSLTSGAKQQFEVVVYREERKNLQDLAKNVLVGYQQYIKAVQKAMKENRNTVTAASIKQQAELLREADRNNNEKLITFYNRNESEKTIQNVYTAVAQFMAETTAGEFDLSDMSVKDLDKLSTNIVNKLYSSFDIKPYDFTYGGETVIIGGFSGVGANLRRIDYKPAKGKSRAIAAFVSTKSQTQALIKKYLNDLLSLEKKLINKAYAEMAKEIFGKGLDALVKSKVTEFVSPYTTAVEQCGLGKIDNVIIKSIDYYKYVKKIISLAKEDPASLLNDLSSMEKLEFTPGSITNSTVNTSMTAYESAKKNLEAAINEYVTTGKVDIFSKIKNVGNDTINSLTADLNCPVEVSVYDKTGNQIGFVGEDNIWYTDGAVYIEKIGDTKRIQSAFDFSLRVVGTDEGVLNCSFTEYNEDNLVGRVTYFDIDLHPGKEISVRLPQEAVSSKTVAVTDSSGSISPSNIIMSEQYQLSTVNISTLSNQGQGGEVIGTGKYVIGDSVKLQAQPNPGYEFLGWQNIDGAYEEVLPVYEFVAKEDRFVAAVFVEQSTGENPGDNPTGVPDPSNPPEPTFSPEPTNSPNPTSSSAPTNPPQTNCAITFLPGVGSGTMNSVSVKPNTLLTLPDCSFTAPDGMRFYAWEIDGVEYQPGDTHFVNHDITVKALWGKVPLNPDDITLPFADVKDDAWFASAVKYVYSKGMMKGTSKTFFSPMGETTRGEIVTILYRLEKEPPVDTSETFTDVPSGRWYSNAVEWAAKNKIVTGYGKGKFGPLDKITREQMVAILSRYGKYKGIPQTGTADLTRFSDYKKISTYALPAMQWAITEEIITGVNSSTVAPQGRAKRAEIATVLKRFCERYDLS